MESAEGIEKIGMKPKTAGERRLRRETERRAPTPSEIVNSGTGRQPDWGCPAVQGWTIEATQWRYTGVSESVILTIPQLMVREGGVPQA